MWRGWERKPAKTTLADHPKGVREAAKETRSALIRKWEYWKLHGFHGYYSCSKCGEMAVCVGRSRNRVRCKSCFFANAKD